MVESATELVRPPHINNGDTTLARSVCQSANVDSLELSPRSRRARSGRMAIGREQSECHRAIANRGAVAGKRLAPGDMQLKDIVTKATHRVRVRPSA